MFFGPAFEPRPWSAVRLACLSLIHGPEGTFSITTVKYLNSVLPLHNIGKSKQARLG